ncbi:ferritin [Nocardia sp. NPDC051900]|uniref:ferritin n=1 Tax=Nocardia sp. NPDC051900 TaxID=3364326 RepID=UPI00379DA081
MPDIDEADESFPDLLRTQIRHGFTTAQQYLAAAVYFDSRRLPQLAGHAYDRSREHYGNSLRMVQYLLDRDLPVQIGGLDEIESTFESPRGAVASLLDIEQVRSARISDLAHTARTSVRLSRRTLHRVVPRRSGEERRRDEHVAGRDRPCRRAVVRRRGVRRPGDTAAAAHRYPGAENGWSGEELIRQH